MDIQELTAAMHSFVRGKGWYGQDSLRPQTPRNLAISLSLEAAEVLEYFQWNGNPAGGDGLASELAEVALYLLQLASISGVELEEAIMDKRDVNSRRSWEE